MPRVARRLVITDSQADTISRTYAAMSVRRAAASVAAPVATESRLDHVLRIGFERMRLNGPSAHKVEDIEMKRTRDELMAELAKLEEMEEDHDAGVRKYKEPYDYDDVELQDDITVELARKRQKEKEAYRTSGQPYITSSAIRRQRWNAKVQNILFNTRLIDDYIDQKWEEAIESEINPDRFGTLQRKAYFSRVRILAKNMLKDESEGYESKTDEKLKKEGLLDYDGTYLLTQNEVLEYVQRAIEHVEKNNFPKPMVGNIGGPRY